MRLTRIFRLSSSISAVFFCSSCTSFSSSSSNTSCWSPCKSDSYVYNVSTYPSSLKGTLGFKANSSLSSATYVETFPVLFSQSPLATCPLRKPLRKAIYLIFKTNSFFFSSNKEDLFETDSNISVV